MGWEVKFSSKVLKQARKLPEAVGATFALLIEQMKIKGPWLPDWKGYGPLKGKDEFHCHLKSGRPTYVAVWTANKQFKIIEVKYVGTHENAPY